ncbi:MAG TPA: hypothetical protein VL358_04320 [Caulobacteraceae bacterium]|jgi:hypothetical protein|nr:hypothetical protein [Caulobacteraceae bacterium]
MKTLLIAAAAALTLGAALPAAAQSWGHDRNLQVRPHEQRYDAAARFNRHGYDWRARERARRIAEQRRLDWLRWRRHGYAYDYRHDYGYRR